MPARKKQTHHTAKVKEVEFGVKGFKAKGAPVWLIVFLVIGAIALILGLNYKSEDVTTTNPDGTTTTTHTQTLRKANP
jgi:hypothetical protein